jgi:hypothetical protein
MSSPHKTLPLAPDAQGARRFIRLIASLFCLLPSTQLLASENSIRWVHGSWVNVRQAADPRRNIIEHVTTNTEVKLIASTGSVCEISWGGNRNGFVPCRLIGDKPLTLADTSRPLLKYSDNTPNPHYSPPRTFWLAPSAAALIATGTHFWNILLPTKQRKLERCSDENDVEISGCLQSKTPPKLVRYPVPEFEAMKKLLENGIIASPDMSPPLLSCRQVQQAEIRQLNLPNLSDWQWHAPHRDNHPHAFSVVHDCIVPEAPQLKLPAPRPSFFKDDKHILPGNASLERISAHFGIVERGRVSKPPKWTTDNNDPRYTGAWDIGHFDLRLDKPIVEQVIGVEGTIGAYSWTPRETLAPNGEYADCIENQGPRKGKTLLSGYSTVKDALLRFQAPAALGSRKATITQHIEIPTVPLPADPNQFTGNVVVDEIDLDGDDAADFVKWNFVKHQWHIIFVNLNGQWYPFEVENAEMRMCGC